MKDCPICERKYVSLQRARDGRDVYDVNCALCGKYLISGSALKVPRSEGPEFLPYLSAHTRQAWELEERKVEISTANWRSFAELHAHTSVRQQADKLLRVVERRTHHVGEIVRIVPSDDFPLLDASRPETVTYFLNYWRELGCLEVSGSDPNSRQIRLTVKGWERLDPLSGGAGIPGQVFVAMSFDESLNRAYDEGIRPAIETDCGMKATRIDKIHHNEKICDRILAEIRRAQLVVADATSHRQGVYFEAGFALGLGRQVIWTCRKNQIDSAHFDTRQYAHILWTTPEDLRTQLKDRLAAMFPISWSAPSA